MRYSLSDYILAIKLPDSFAQKIGLSNNSIITIGGEGSYLNSIEFSYNTDLFSTKADATGSWVHDKNLDRSGRITISIHQLSEKISLFKKVINLYYQSSVKDEGLQLSLQDSYSNEIASGEDCYFVKMPNQVFGQESDNQSWDITSGRIIIN